MPGEWESGILWLRAVVCSQYSRDVIPLQGAGSIVCCTVSSVLYSRLSERHCSFQVRCIRLACCSAV